MLLRCTWQRRSKADGRRFIAAAGQYSNNELASIIKERFPELSSKLPEHIERESSAAGYSIDNSSATDVLGVKFRMLDDAVVDTVSSLMRV
jgi:nucleoside-diphosphate-sugar epimerase